MKRIFFGLVFASHLFGVGQDCVVNFLTTTATDFTDFYGTTLPLLSTQISDFANRPIWNAYFEGPGARVPSDRGYRIWGFSASFIAVKYSQNECQSDFAANSQDAVYVGQIDRPQYRVRTFAILAGDRTWNTLVSVTRGITFVRQ
jgi:hypothetical protein